MGKDSAAKRPPRRVKSLIPNPGFQIPIHGHFFWCFVFLCFFAGNIFAQNNFETFTEIINRGNTEQKRSVLLQIRNLETEAASRTAIPALRDSSEIVRATAAFSVIYLPKDEALQILLPLLGDKNEFVRREAAYALGKVRNPNAIAPLSLVFQKDKIVEVKNAAVVALGEIGDTAAIDFLTQILQRKPKKDDTGNEFLRRSAARSIGQVAQIIQTGKIQVFTPNDFLPDKFVLFTPPNFIYLSRNNPVFLNANNILIKTLQNTREAADTRREAAFALGAIGEESAIAVLQLFLNDEDYYLARIAKESIREIQFVQYLRQKH